MYLAATGALIGLIRGPFIFAPMFYGLHDEQKNRAQVERGFLIFPRSLF